MKTSISLDAKGIRLEGRLDRQSASRAVVITHPHPLYGGDMNNNVVSIIADAYAESGWTTLRFNFRGTGDSSGRYDDGVGEQQDIQAAVDYLGAEGFKEIELAGYSFGAWVLANWSKSSNATPHPLRMVSPPVAFVDFDLKATIPGLKDVFTGQHDDIAPPVTIESAMSHWHPDARLHIIQGADHFFGNRAAMLKHEIIGAIT